MPVPARGRTLPQTRAYSGQPHHDVVPLWAWSDPDLDDVLIAVATLVEVATNPDAAKLTRRRASRTLATYGSPLKPDDAR